MPLTRVKYNITQRFSLVLVNLNHLESEEQLIRSVEVSAANKPNESVHKIQKGLYYVHLYSAYEKSFNEIVERCLLYIEAKKVLHQHYAMPFNSIALDAKLKSLKAAGKDRMMERSISLFETMAGNSHTKINEVMFATKLQNVWFKTLDQTLTCFGADKFVDPMGDFQIAIDEVVDKRNAVAHGRIPADKVGERQEVHVLRDRTVKIQSALDIIINNLSIYLINKDFIANQYTGNY